MEKYGAQTTALGRLLIALLFVFSGINKLVGYAGMQGYMQSAGVPAELLPLVILLEIVGGLMIMVGWKVRITAGLLAGFCLSSAILFHNDLANPGEFIAFMKNVSIAGGFLFLVANGAGGMSLEKISLRRRDKKLGITH